MWYGKNEFRDELFVSNDEWTPTTIVVKKCDCERQANIAKLKAELEEHFEKVLSE